MVARAKTEDDLVDLWGKVVDPEYARSIRDADDAGMDVVHMQASQLAELDTRQLAVQQAYYLLPHSDQLGEPASSGRRSVGSVEVERAATDSGNGERRILAGTELEGHVVDSMGVDRVTGFYRTTEDVTLAAGDLGPVTLPVEATVVGFAGDQPAGTITRFRTRGTGVLEVVVDSTTTVHDVLAVDLDVFNEGERGLFLLLDGLDADSYPRVMTNVSQGSPSSTATLDPPLPAGAVGNTYVARVLEHNDLFSVEQIAPTTGGRDDTLGEIGRERNKPKAEGETDDEYRKRLARLEDTISPNAIRRLCTRMLQPYGIRFHIEETRDGVHGFILDLAPLDTGVICSQTDPWASSVLLNDNDAVRFFVICVSGPDQTFGDPSTPLDSTTDGVNAYDAGGPGDGSPVTYNQVIARLWRAVNAARLFGVNFAIVQDQDL